MNIKHLDLDNTRVGVPELEIILAMLSDGSSLLITGCAGADSILEIGASLACTAVSSMYGQGKVDNA